MCVQQEKNFFPQRSKEKAVCGRLSLCQHPPSSSQSHPQTCLGMAGAVGVEQGGGQAASS